MSEISSCLPVLSTTIPYLTTRSDVGAALTKFLLLNPGRTSDMYEEFLLSFRTIASEFGQDRSGICQELQSRMYQALHRYFPDENIVTDFTTSDYDTTREGDPRYRVNFNVYFNNDNGTITPSIVSGYFNIADNNEIEVKFQ